MPTSTTSLAIVAHILDVPLENMSQWQVFRPEAFHPGPDGYDVGAISRAGRDWMHRRTHEVDELLSRLDGAADVVNRHGDLFGDVANHIKRITPQVVELGAGPQTPKTLATLRAVVEGAIARCRSAGLDVDNASAPMPAVTPAATPRFAAALDAEL